MEAAETDGFITQHIINDMKSSAPVWEDFLAKAAKLHSSLRTVAQTTDSFLDAFQKVADVATSSRGSTRDIGVSLTKMVMRHRSIENKLRLFTGLLYDALICPLHDRLDDWKKIISQIDRDHAKEYKKSRQEMKKMAAEAQKWQKKVKKGKSEHQERYENAMKMANAQLASFEDQERKSLRKVLVEERTRFCLLFNYFKPVVDHEISMLSEIDHLQSLVDNISKQTDNPNLLPPSAEDLLETFKIPDSPVYHDEQSPPPSPTSSIFERKFPSGVPLPMSPTMPGSGRSGSPVPAGVERRNFQRTWTWTGPRHPPNISRRSNSMCSSSSTIIGRSPSPDKGNMRTKHQRDSISSHSSNVSSSYSSMSSLGSSVDSPSVESLPNPPAPPTVCDRPPPPDEMPPPPPAFAPEPDTLSVNDHIQELEPPHSGAGHWKVRPVSMQTTDSGCYSSSSGERSPFSSMGQVCPPYGRSDSISQHDEGEGSESHYATPHGFHHRRTNSESANTHYEPVNNHSRFYQRCNSESGYYKQTMNSSLNTSDDLPPPPDFLSCDASPDSSFNSTSSYDDSYYVHPSNSSPFKRSYSIAGRPSAAQLERIIAKGRGGPPLRRGKPPPPPVRTTGLTSLPVKSGDMMPPNDCENEPKMPASGKDLLAQIQRQRLILRAKSEEHPPSGDER